MSAQTPKRTEFRPISLETCSHVDYEVEMVKGGVHVPRRAISPETRYMPGTTAPDSRLLAVPLEDLLISGGDPRLTVDPIRMLNRFGCRAWPRPDALTFASSTATTISSQGFAAASAMHQRLQRSIRTTDLTTACNHQTQELRNQIRATLFPATSGVEIVFSPSGTDSEVHALYIAQSVLRGSLVSVILAADETGSGVGEAAIGRHFSSGTSQGATVVKSERIGGFAADTASISIPLRESDGRLLTEAEIDKAVMAALGDSVKSGKRVVLHVMDSSKFGCRCPSLECVGRIRETWGDSVQVVVDACQMRLSRPRLTYYLNQGFMVLITGSKYFTGPPFSGALLVPAAISALMEHVDTVPEGLKLYSNRNDWPETWTGVRSKLRIDPNVGQLLRWAAAFEEMRAYFAVPAPFRLLALQLFASTVEELIAKKPHLQLVPACKRSRVDEFDEEEMATRTIFPFFVRHQGKLLSVDDCTRIYRSLNCDTAHLLLDSATFEEKQLAETSCQISQPVGVLDPLQGSVGTLRISAGARLISESWCTAGESQSLSKLNQHLDQVGLILDKIDLLLNHFDALSASA